MISDENVQHEDRIVRSFRSYAQHILVVIFGLLPIIFLPIVVAPFEYTKVGMVIVGILIALVLFSLSVLRSGAVPIGISYTLIALWGVVGSSFISSLLSGDFRDSLIGDLFSIHATIFVGLLALIPTIWVLLKVEKASVMRMYILLALSTLVLVVFHFLRLFFGADILSFDIFTSSVQSPVGGWNDLALFLGLTVILSLIALEQLPLTKLGRILFGVVILASLGMLGIINFFMVWVVLGITSLVIIVYSLGKDRFTGGGQLSLSGLREGNSTSLTIALVVCVLSVVFIIGGSTIGGILAKYTGISYVEVRPSLEATIDIARNVYHENAFFGIGANKFIDAWRLHRDPAIGQTLFWNTDFNAGNGYVSTFFVTTGVLGGCAWIVFFLVFLITGVRRLLSTTNGDRMWYFIGVSSFVSAMYIWVMSIVYVPGAVMLLLGGLCTGVALSAMNVLSGAGGRTLSVGTNRRTGFVLTLGVIAVIIVSVSTLYTISRHYASVYTFNKSVEGTRHGEQLDAIEKYIEQAFQYSRSDVYARRMAELQINRMSSLATIAEPTEAELLQFQRARELGISAAQQAVQIDSLEPANWSMLGSIYGVLATIGIQGAGERAREALTKSRDLNPKNPLPYLELAIVEARGGNFERARAYINDSIKVKSNFTEAFFLLSQIEIIGGNVEAAIESTRAVISLEPQNPARYYQLGVLETSRKNLEGAVPAFERAVELDQNYANARYLLALAYDELGRSSDAKVQLEAVRALNPNNIDIVNLIQVLETDGSLERLRTGTSKTVQEVVPETNQNGTVSTTQVLETSLVTPVNTAPKVEEGETVTE